MAFTIFYDSHCPLCAKEMTSLKKYDKQNNLRFVDIMHEDFTTSYPELDWSALNERIHGMCDDGTILVGLDATHRAWNEVGKGWLYAPLRWPIIRFFADKLYLVFAKNRYSISFWLTGEKRCDERCELSSKVKNE